MSCSGKTKFSIGMKGSEKNHNDYMNICMKIFGVRSAQLVCSVL